MMLHFLLFLTLPIWAQRVDSAASLPIMNPLALRNAGEVCTVTPAGCKEDDTPQIIQAFEKCNNGGTVVFLEGRKYNIASRLSLDLRDVTVEWRGLWQVSARHIRGASELYSIGEC